MFHYTTSTTYQHVPPPAQPGTFFDVPPHQSAYTASPCCSSGYVFAPLSAPELHGYTMCNAFETVGFFDAQETSTPLDVGIGWSYFDELDHALWVRDTAPQAPPTGNAIAASAPLSPPPSTRPAGPRRPRPRACQLTTPAESARRRAHRRSLQKGYEKDYRDRKRQKRETLRSEWMRLEYQLKTALLEAQNRAVQHVDMASTSAMDRKLLDQLEAEREALCVEHTLLTFKLLTEERLQEAHQYFTQPEMREKLNALATTHSVIKFQFTW